MTQRRAPAPPGLLEPEVGRRRLVEAVDYTNPVAFLRIGERHKVTGIVHLAAVGPDGIDPVDTIHANTLGLLNVLRAAKAWAVRHVGIASTLGV